MTWPTSSWASSPPTGPPCSPAATRKPPPPATPPRQRLHLQPGPRVEQPNRSRRRCRRPATSLTSSTCSVCPPSQGPPMSPPVTTINPAPGEALQSYNAAGLDDALAILDAVHTAQPGWAAVPVEQRADHLQDIGAQLRTH